MKSYEIIFKVTTRHKKRVFADSRKDAMKKAEDMETFYIENAKIIEHSEEVESVEEE